jgi:hypothetical protein
MIPRPGLRSQAARSLCRQWAAQSEQVIGCFQANISGQDQQDARRGGLAESCGRVQAPAQTFPMLAIDLLHGPVSFQPHFPQGRSHDTPGLATGSSRGHDPVAGCGPGIWPWCTGGHGCGDIFAPSPGELLDVVQCLLDQLRKTQQVGIGVWVAQARRRQELLPEIIASIVRIVVAGVRAKCLLSLGQILQYILSRAGDERSH